MAAAAWLLLVTLTSSALAGSTASHAPIGAPGTAIAAAATRAGVLFGLGPEADGARRSPLRAAARIGMLSSWYNGPSDLGWMTAWKDTEIRRDYAAGYALHLIVWSGEAHTILQTRYGPACGQAYPLSGRFLTDMERLARAFTAPPGRRLYVTLFSEFQTYACNGNAWSSDARTSAYFGALEDQYRRALAIFHRLAPGSAVSLGWGGWQARWNAPASGGGRSLFAHFASVMRASDFESFDVIGSGSAASDMLAMTRQLARFGPVMLAYYKPGEPTAAGRRAELATVLSASLLGRLTRERLFAFGFMDDGFAAGDPASVAIVRRAVASSGCRGCAMPH